MFGEAGKNLSCYERNRVYTNRGDGRFVESSWVTGADDDADSRGAVAADLDGDGRVELLTRQVGGGPLKLYRNRHPATGWLTVRLRGTASNRLGVGARLTLTVGGRRLVRELTAANTFWAQAPAEVTVGLGAAHRVERLEVRWPSGATQVLEGLDADRRILVDEAAGEVVAPPRR